MERYATYRVVAVTDCPPKDICKPFSFTSHSYCMPESRIWMTQVGLEVPNAEPIILELVDGPFTKFRNWRVEFEYDGGQYIGTLLDFPSRRWKVVGKRLGVHNISALIHDISSL